MDLARFHDFDPSAVIVRDHPFENLGFDLRFPLAGMLTYCGTVQFLRQAAADAGVACILTTEKVHAAFRKKHGEIAAKGLAYVQSPREGFFRFHNFLCEHTDFYGRPDASHVGTNARISPTAVVARRNVRIGDRVTIGDHVVVHENVTIGDDVHLGTGTVVGESGFQFLRTTSGILRIHHAGGVTIGNDIEIHSHCTVDRAIFREDTTIGDGTKLDNGVHFAHRSRIGQRGLLAARACVCGSVVIGDDVWIGPAAVVSDSVVVGDRARIAIGAVVVRDVEDGESVAGNFAIDRDQFVEKNLQGLLRPSKD